MNDVKFKVGDLVYCPNLTAGIVTLRHTLAYQESRKKLDSIPFYVFEFSYLPFGCANGGFLYYVNENGCHDTHQKPIIFHATQENYELLSQLYPNVTFEPPTNQKEPREIIKALLDDGNSGVLCWVSNYYHEPSYNNSKAQIVTVVNDDDFYCSGCSFVKYATPIIPIKTFNQKIIDFVNGEVVLESENE